MISLDLEMLKIGQELVNLSLLLGANYIPSKFRTHMTFYATASANWKIMNRLRDGTAIVWERTKIIIGLSSALLMSSTIKESTNKLRSFISG